MVRQNWELYETCLADSTLALKDVKTRLNRSMSEWPSERPGEEQFYEVNMRWDKRFGLWNGVTCLLQLFTAYRTYGTFSALSK